MPDLAVQALALTIRHLKQFGNMEMTLSANALEQLEVTDILNVYFCNVISLDIFYAQE